MEEAFERKEKKKSPCCREKPPERTLVFPLHPDIKPRAVAVDIPPTSSISTLASLSSTTIAQYCGKGETGIT